MNLICTMTVLCKCCTLLKLSCQGGPGTGILSTVNISSPFSCPWLLDKCNIGTKLSSRFKKKLAASSMQHEAKIAYYAFDVIRFFVPYAARLKLRGRVAR